MPYRIVRLRLKARDPSGIREQSWQCGSSLDPSRDCCGFGQSPYIIDMEPFDYDEPAELFVHAWRVRARAQVTYRKFSTGAEALKYVIEVLGPDARAGAVIETEQGRYESNEMRALYESSAYPLRRCGA